MYKTLRWLSVAMATGILVAACGGTGATTPLASVAIPSVAVPSVAIPSVAIPSIAAGSPVASAMSLPVVDCEQGSTIAGGSTAMQPVVEAAKESYQAGCAGSSVDVQGGGSGTGLTQVAAGAFQIGDSDVDAFTKLATPDANALVDHQVLRQGFIMVTSQDVTGVSNLTTQQATDIWTGKITNWKDVGGPDEPIVLIIRPQSSGTRAVFKAIVLKGANEASGQALTEDSNGAVTQAVSTTPGGTSYIGFAYYQQNKASLNGLQLDGIDATVANITSGTYKLQALGHMYTKGDATGLTKAFIDFMLSDGVQHQLIPSLFYAPIQ
ncbi:MAG TPA: phosphate ABC transporter substrate-binding protein [Candidatus Limnocylindrales bacterium]